MHEISLIHGMIELINASSIEHKIKRVFLVRLVVGESYGALPEALDFAFKVVTQNTICQGAVLEVVVTPGMELYLDYYEGE